MTVDDKKIAQQLLTVGIRVNGIYDLVNTNQKYPEAIPILIDLLKQEVPNVRIREGLVRALSVKEAKGLANETLLRIYAETPNDDRSFRWAIGNAFSVILEPQDIPKILEIVKDQSNGRSRQMFVMALGKIKDSENVESSLIDLLRDDEVVLHAIAALKKIKSVRALEKMADLEISPRSIVRREVKKYREKVKSTPNA